MMMKKTMKNKKNDKNKKDNNSESIKNQRNMLIDYINKKELGRALEEVDNGLIKVVKK